MTAGRNSVPKILRARTLTAMVALAAAAVIAIGVEAKSTPEPALVGQRVDNFMLADQSGVGHELYYHKAASAIVILTASLGDSTSERAVAELGRLRAAYADKGVEFLVLNSSTEDSREEIAAAMKGQELPVLDDELQLVGRSLGVKRTGEVFVVNPRGWTIAYHGPIDASFADRKGSKASLKDALEATLSGRAVATAEARVKGAAIAFPDRERAASFAKISYANDVAPILAETCVTCHTTGGMGPFAMDRYETVKGFAPMIREVIRTGRMPPFHSDGYGHKWSNEMGLTPAQKLTLVNWIEAGSPRGEGEDPLPKAQHAPDAWPLGQPDAVVEIPAFTVPATGLIDYQERSIPTNFGDGQGRWLKATAWTGSSATVHHALAGWIPEVRADGQGFSWNTSLGGYGPGGEANLTPPETGIWVPAGGSYAYQMHYTSVGKETTDKTKVGYYFYKEPPKYILRQASVTDFSIEIPAGKARHHETAYLEFPHDALIFGTQPHCHSRCYATKLRIRYPDGTEKLLLNQPRYDFGWQREYHFDPMLEVPAGSMLIADYIFDNSTGNPANPDPKLNVTFGEQTSEEMLFTFARFRWKEETVENRKDAWMSELQRNITFGAFDDNIDGKLTAAEFRNDPRFAPLKGYIGMVDADKDGALSKAEFNKALDAMQQMRRQRGASAPAAPAADKGTAAMTQGAVQ